MLALLMVFSTCGVHLAIYMIIACSPVAFANPTTTCAQVKQTYKEQGCCGKGDQPFNSESVCSPQNETQEVPTFVYVDPCKGETKRIRKSWLHLSAEEKQLWYDAVNLAKERGDYRKFVNVHRSSTNNIKAHRTAHFLPWHRKMVLEFENHLRSLGPRFSCITIPYWNWAEEGDECTFAAGSKVNGSDCLTYQTYSQTLIDLGGAGSSLCSTSPFCAYSQSTSTVGGSYCVKDHPAWGPISCQNLTTEKIYTKGSSLNPRGNGQVGCVTTGPFGNWTWEENGRQICLTRAVNFTIDRADPANGDMVTGLDMLELIGKRRRYGPDWSGEFDVDGTQTASGFRLGLEGKPHAKAHMLVGGHMISYESVGDPLFWLHHSMIDRMFSLWQDCHDYEDDPYKSGGFAPYSTIITGRYWTRNLGKGFGHVTPRASPHNSGPYHLDPVYPPVDTADPNYMADRRGVIDDGLLAPMRFKYSEYGKCSLGPELMGACYECIVQEKPECRAMGLDSGRMIIEDYCLFICGFPKCKAACNISHDPDEYAYGPEHYIDTWNPDVSVPHYLSNSRLPGGVSVTYQDDHLSHELSQLSACNMSNAEKKSSYNELEGTYTYRAFYNSVDMDADTDSFLMGKGIFRLFADGEDKVVGRLEFGKGEQIYEVNGTIEGKGVGAVVRMESHVKNWGNIQGFYAKYVYYGFKANNWHDAVELEGFSNKNQIVGTVMRDKTYQYEDGVDGKVRQKGAVGSFFMVKM